MNTAGKIILGIILIIGSIWWIGWGSFTYIRRSGVNDLVTVLNGSIPVLIFILGIFIVWLEYDELKIERELAAEERKAKRRKRTTRRKKR